MVDVYKQFEGDLPVPVIEEVKRQAEENKLTSAQVKKALEETKKEYEDSLISPGESIGIVTAESIGEPRKDSATPDNDVLCAE